MRYNCFRAVRFLGVSVARFRDRSVVVVEAIMQQKNREEKEFNFIYDTRFIYIR